MLLSKSHNGETVTCLSQKIAFSPSNLVSTTSNTPGGHHTNLKPGIRCNNSHTTSQLAKTSAGTALVQLGCPEAFSVGIHHCFPLIRSALFEPLFLRGVRLGGGACVGWLATNNFNNHERGTTVQNNLSRKKSLKKQSANNHGNLWVYIYILYIYIYSPNATQFKK